MMVKISILFTTNTHTELVTIQTHLQWTTMGPASGGLQAFTRRRKARMGVGYSGTPWSGQAMNWNCLTSLFSLEPFCRRVSRLERLKFRLSWILCYTKEKLVMLGKNILNSLRSDCWWKRTGILQNSSTSDRTVRNVAILSKGLIAITLIAAHNVLYFMSPIILLV